ncbi:class I SAM-dependent methyltransferase [Isoptericola halotolerans]|uniref:SAM-dependent methyltransferase n=1 Tax=Isoptericola halotolerans TaxID=300560 RepID=A0ABX2A4Y6_9MICO|nr:class I SAM-dependent methyltransferase [Isoptericola halotolerans]NOV97917.1 SAM-dependent methyltransferase [Isoptericola halotolerans]
MTNYAMLYRLGLTPWERYRGGTAGLGPLLDREEAERRPPFGRALDLGCGRGQHTSTLARRGWEAVGIDLVPRAIDAARRTAPARATYVVGDVTNLESAGVGTFDLFLDVGCLQGLTAEQRTDVGRGVTALAAPGATLLLLAFGPRLRWMTEGVAPHEVEAAFARWELLSVEPADTSGLGFPMNRTAPRWYRMRRRGTMNAKGP